MAKVTGILGKKVGMTQLFDEKGDVHPQTRDGYDAAQLGLVEFVKESRLTKPMRGHLGKNNLPPVKFMREVPIEVADKTQPEGDGAVKAGDRVLVDIFEGERFVDIIGTSKGRGFQGSAPRRFLRACSRECGCPATWVRLGSASATCGFWAWTRMRTCWWWKALCPGRMAGT